MRLKHGSSDLLFKHTKSKALIASTGHSVCVMAYVRMCGQDVVSVSMYE